MSKVALVINGDTEQTQIGPIKVIAFTLGLKKVKEIFNLLKKDNKLAEFTEYLATQEPKEEGEEETAADKEFISKLAESFDVLLDTVPEKVIELLAIASGVKVEIINDQEAEVLFDLFDAIVAENDIPKLIARAKKSFLSVKGKLAQK